MQALSLDWSDFNAHHGVAMQCYVLREIANHVASKIIDGAEREEYLRVATIACKQMDNQYWLRGTNRAVRLAMRELSSEAQKRLLSGELEDAPTNVVHERAHVTWSANMVGARFV